jgi:serine/threonine protein kinase
LNLISGELMAVKKLKVPKNESSVIKQIENEVELMQRLRHPNIVEYLGIQEKDDTLFIFMEYMSSGSLSR